MSKSGMARLAVALFVGTGITAWHHLEHHAETQSFLHFYIEFVGINATSIGIVFGTGKLLRWIRGACKRPASGQH